MKQIVILLNLLILIFFTYWIVTEVYEGLRFGMTKNDDFFSFGLKEYFIYITLSILLPILNIFINLGKIKNRFLLYLAIIKNFIIVFVCSLVLLKSVYEKLFEDIADWQKTSHQVELVIFFVGTILPLICIYLIYSKQIRSKIY